jgi:hypothetical protein
MEQYSTDTRDEGEPDNGLTRRELEMFILFLAVFFIETD